jgi:geranylgeranyl diphosphate synthase type II
MKLPDFFESDLKVIEAELEKLLPREDAPPTSIHRAMRYSVFAGGKRLRPILCYEASRLYTLNPEPVVPVAAAIEFIHTYSLIHDDLPALDNDDLRRGKQTCHKVFGEAIAILAGDALLTLAFKTLAEAPLDTAMRRVHVMEEVATAAGTVNGMVGGQVADIEAEGKEVTPQVLEFIHRSKTAALIRGAVTAGGIAGGAGDAHIDRLRRFGEQIGWAFQIVDDILDVEESSAALGKTAGKDEAQKKATYPALYGIEKSREIADDLAKKALKELDCYGERAGRMRALSQFLLARRS